ncbi:geranylgeranyl diphosphate synthase, type II [[Clostridium] aminophilum]|uniref:Farnesyl diphosphate synthase n=1 Tax=[Clostridium] aminophilum TaxID=1526 RepID=A0A1I0F6Y8_9FIRM|nr:farnesyl diphosphate synthase [[Clostridium] aminophilum]SET53020.1 geranylgeranyl diphosphate synthase, type II [[Clostridium] aminophilum]
MSSDLFQREKQEIDAIVASYLPEEKGEQATIFRAMNYSVEAGGKRIRPMLMREVYRLFGGTGREIEPMMAAMEMMHTASLIHDDLPCMDNDEFRRGKKTTWAVFGEDMATLTGDALMIYTFETAAKALELTDDPAKVARCMRILAEKSGVYGMTGGQCVDVELTGKAIPKETLNFIYRLKTGALLEGSMMIGAVMAGASEEDIRKVEKMAADIGLAFQIEDDILDEISTTEELGKPVGSDEKNHKTTYVTVEGLEKSRSDAERLSEEAVEILHELPGENRFLEEIIRKLVSRKK